MTHYGRLIDPENHKQMLVAAYHLGEMESRMPWGWEKPTKAVHK